MKKIRNRKNHYATLDFGIIGDEKFTLVAHPKSRFTQSCGLYNSLPHPTLECVWWKPWQTPLNKAPSKGEKKEQRESTQVWAKRGEPNIECVLTVPYPKVSFVIK